MTNEEFITNLNKIYEETGHIELPLTQEKPNNIMSTDGELKQWQKDVMEKDYVDHAKLMKNSLYGKMCCENDPVNHPSHYTDMQGPAELRASGCGIRKAFSGFPVWVVTVFRGMI